MSTNDNLKNIIAQVNASNKNHFPALKLVQDNMEQAALISKLINDPGAPVKTPGINNREELLNNAQMRTISDNIRARIKDNENILSIFPDIELAIQILISTILSPKDMVKTDLIYKLKDSIFPSTVTGGLLDIIREEFDGYYGLKDDLQFILRDIISRSGSHVKMVLPESIVDAMINEDTPVALENLQDIFQSGSLDKITPIGFLGGGVGQPSTGSSNISALESFFKDEASDVAVDPRVGFVFKDKIEYIEGLEVVDNYNFLKLPKLLEVGSRQKVKTLISLNAKKSTAAIESFTDKKKKLTAGEIASAIYKNPDRRPANLMVLPSSHNTKRRSVGRCYYTKLPPECCIPLHAPGNPEEHLGYFVLADNQGNWISDAAGLRDVDGLAGVINNQGGNQNMNSLLIERAKNNLVSDGAVPTIDNVSEITAAIVENDLIQRYMKGVNGREVAVSSNRDIYRIMTARALKGKSTRLVYVPKEFISYFALKYYPNGTGKAYLDEVKNLTSIRAILLFSKVMAHVKSSINVTRANITFDPNDPDPEKTIEIIQHEMANIRSMYFPLGINSPYDLTDWIQRAGMEYTFENHPGLPSTKITFETDNFKHEIPDESLDELLRKQTYMAIGVPPEKLDQGFDGDFATSITHNNLLLAKRTANVQDVFVVLLTDNGKRILRYDQEIRARLLEYMDSKKGEIQERLSDEEKEAYTANPSAYMEVLLDRAIEILSLELPRPDVASLDTQKEAFTAYQEACKEAIEFWVSGTVATEGINGEIAANMEAYRDIFMGILMRRWMVENNYLAEMAEIVGSDEDKKPLVDVLEQQVAHVEGLAKSFLGYTEKMKELKAATDADLQKLGATGDEATSVSDDASLSSDTTDELNADDNSLDGGLTPEPEIPTEEENTPKEDEQEVAPEQATPDASENT